MEESVSKKQMPHALVLGLSFADLRHEWTLTLCLMLAIAAVISPLLLLFGLKYGTIETLRFRLIQDPRNREVRPLVSTSFERDWFDRLRQREDIAFITPMTRQISSQVSAWRILESGERSEVVDLDMVPTDEGDVLLLENGAPVPGEGECVLSHFGAEGMGAVTGDEVVIEVSRTRGNRRERETLDLKVVGVLGLRANTLKSIYVPLPLLENVESFKDGQAVPELGWEGDTPGAYPLWNGVVVSTPQELTELLERRLRANTGFTRARDLSPAVQAEDLGYRLPEDRFNLLLHTEMRAMGASSVAAVENQLRGRNADVIPWMEPMGGTLWLPEDDSIPVSIRILPAEAAALETSPPVPWDNPLAAGRSLLKVAVSTEMPESVQEEGCAVEVPIPDGSLRFPVSVLRLEGLEPGRVFVQSRLGGILNLAATRPIEYEPGSEEFLLSRRGYAGFRLYGKKLEDIDGLRRHFEAEGIPVHTEAAKIQSVLEMDRYLTLIFWLIALVGIAGSIASLVASLYASVERKRKELSVLRLIGFSGGQLFCFPIYQSVMIASGAFGLAWVAFGLISETINRLFSSHLQEGESFCRLPGPYLLAAFACAVAIACAAALAAVIRLSQIDPAEALRDE